MSYKNIPKKAGFYLESGKSCKFANSVQISDEDYRLENDLYYRSIAGDIFVVKKGFIHDGASKGFLKRFGLYTNSAILHDALYRSESLSRSKNDNLFLESMKVHGVGYFRRYTYYWSVRGAGWIAYSSHEDDEVKAGKKFIEIIKKDKR